MKTNNEAYGHPRGPIVSDSDTSVAAWRASRIPEYARHSAWMQSMGVIEFEESVATLDAMSITVSRAANLYRQAHRYLTGKDIRISVHETTVIDPVSIADEAEGNSFHLYSSVATRDARSEVRSALNFNTWRNQSRSLADRVTPKAKRSRKEIDFGTRAVTQNMTRRNEMLTEGNLDMLGAMATHLGCDDRRTHKDGIPFESFEKYDESFSDFCDLVVSLHDQISESAR